MYTKIPLFSVECVYHFSWERDFVRLEENEMTIKEKRIATGLPVETAAKLLGFPVKLMKDWEEEVRRPPAYIEQRILQELDRIAEKRNQANGI